MHVSIYAQVYMHTCMHAYVRTNFSASSSDVSFVDTSPSSCPNDVCGKQDSEEDETDGLDNGVTIWLGFTLCLICVSCVCFGRSEACA
jgi:hypothetical protein